MIKTFIISGFLGSGKTTLIKKIVSGNHNLGRLMLLENEFGKVGIDGTLLKSNLKVKEINDGCICCGLEGKLEDALDEIKNYEIDTLIIEPSGVAKLSELIKTIHKHRDFSIISHAVMVDILKFEKYHKNFKEFFDDQIMYANTIILSRSDLVEHKFIKNIVHQIEELNANAIIVTTPIKDLSTEFLIDVLSDDCLNNDCCCAHKEKHQHNESCELNHTHHHKHHDHTHHHKHHDHTHHHEETCSCGHDHSADEIFTSLDYQSAKVFSKEELEKCLSELPETVIRAKGIVASNDGWLHFEYTPGEINIEKHDPHYTGIIIVIGTKLCKNCIAKVFKIND